MAGRVAYYGNITTQGLVLNLDAGRKDSYPRTGTSWIDISGNNNNGTLTNGPTYSDGAIVFDGVDDYANVPTFNQTFSSLTLGTWIKLSGPQSNFAGVIYSRGGGGSTTGLNFIGSVYGGNGYKVGLTYNNTGFTTPGPQLLDNTWTQVYLAFSPTSTVYYINGAPSLTLGSYGSSTTLASLKLGYDTDSASRVFKGSMAQTQIYNQALTQHQVWQNFNAMKGRYGIPDIVTDGLVLNLDAGNPYSYLSGSSGTTWTDVSGNGNNGTLTNGASYANGAIVFDGVDDEVSFTGVNFGALSAFTICGFVKPTLSGDSSGTVANNSNTSSPYGWHCRLTDVSVRFWVNAAHYDGDALTSNQWNFFAITVSPTTIIHYKDGVANNTYNGTFNTFVTNNAPFRMGRWEGGDYYYDGNIGNFCYYNRALSQEEITQNFNALRGRYGI